MTQPIPWPLAVRDRVAARPAAVRWAILVAVLVGVLAGCSSAPSSGVPPEEHPASPFRACPAAGPASGTSGGAGIAGTADGAGDPMPAVTLPCFTGGEPVPLAALGRPAVVNVWASYCGPCRTELPELQHFADAVGDRAVVLGVVSQDTRDRAAYAGADFGVSFPAVFDPDGMLLKSLGRNAIPLTLFVDETGSVRHIDMTGALTLAKLRTLSQEYLGISA